MRMIAIALVLLTNVCTVGAEDRIVLAELFTASWCATCPYADAALDSLALEIGKDSLAVLQYHVADAYATGETTARAEWYMDPVRLPYAWFDGTTSVHEISSVADAYSKYRNEIETRLLISSPLTIESAVSLGDTSGEVSAKIRVVEAFSDEALRFFGVLYENGVDEYNYVVRDILLTEALSIATPGDSVEVSRLFHIDTLWNREKMGMVVFVQSDSTREVLQAERIEDLSTRIEESPCASVQATVSLKVMPSPFSNSVQFVISSPGQRETEVEVYDSSGRLVRTLLARRTAKAEYSLHWDGKGSDGGEVRSGVYYVRLAGPGGVVVRKVVCIR